MLPECQLFGTLGCHLCEQAEAVVMPLVEHGLLVELLELVRNRPGITTGAVLEHFADREEEPALQKLALQGFPGEEAAWRHELVDALAQLDRQVSQQRVDELQARIREVGMSGLSDHEKAELRELHAAPR